ncbi:hypothetical protein [Sporosarcina sp. FSL K6-1508]|uniref:hypothetical protein n=1 Tax=Sporosarcina sp. FSL K6-1508 TaxID=2921553 RepID=UPI0030F67C36
MQLLKASEEAGITIGDSEVYKELNRMITESADMGLSNDFSINTIQPNHAVPFSLNITPEQEVLIDTLEQDNQVVKMENFKFESVK